MINRNFLSLVYIGCMLAVMIFSLPVYSETCHPGDPPVDTGILAGCPVNSVCEYYCKGIPGTNYTKGQCWWLRCYCSC
ncbi:hypothetical protein DdX_15939 [Ditylenchus destructor]|uniref:Uncharacterized protein n=1 Tax=Ditylenchus destructor TaxID=166010 RepID=A0AAD4MPX5_9BILA|nr:hypothetical protein DdX_15939 [Ditylenchus destructor]